MPQQALDNEDVHLLVIEMRGKCVSESMAGYSKGRVQIGPGHDFLEVVFHGPDRQSVALFRDEQGRRGGIVVKDGANSEIFCQDVKELIVEMEFPYPVSFAVYGEGPLLKIDTFEIQAMHLADPQSGQIHQGRDRIIPDAENGGPVNGGKETFYLAIGECLGVVFVPLPDFQDTVEGQSVRRLDIYQSKMLGISAEGKDFTVDGAAGVMPFFLEEILKIHDRRAVNDGVVAVVDKVFEQFQVDTVCPDSLVACLVNGFSVMKEGINVTEEILNRYSHWSPPEIATLARASFFM